MNILSFCVFFALLAWRAFVALRAIFSGAPQARPCARCAYRCDLGGACSPGACRKGARCVRWQA